MFRDRGKLFLTKILRFAQDDMESQYNMVGYMVERCPDEYRKELEVRPTKTADSAGIHSLPGRHPSWTPHQNAPGDTWK
jgi:hypothetical protein